jgi:hypothetical protein
MMRAFFAKSAADNLLVEVMTPSHQPLPATRPDIPTATNGMTADPDWLWETAIADVSIERCCVDWPIAAEHAAHGLLV